MTTRFLARLMAGLLLALALAGPAGAAPMPITPRPMLNGMVSLAQIGQMGRVYVQYDVRSLGASGLNLYLFRFNQNPRGKPLEEWQFGTPNGRQRISFDNLPIQIYKVWAQAVDENGKPVALPSALVWVEYGGWRAWRDYNDSFKSESLPPFAEIPVSTGTTSQPASLHLIPAAAVVNPGQTVEFQAVLKGPARGATIDWGVQGGGSLRAQPGKPNSMVYVAPDVSQSRMCRVTATSRSDSSLTASASVLVTTVSTKSIKK